MKEQLQYDQLEELMYMSKSGEITKRRVKVVKITVDKFQAFCFMKHSMCAFIIDNVLAVISLIYKEKIIQ
ncbi:transcriptional regulator [Rummeliibacillus pycnus]|uniref:transcriptional regulator n=1 Tax=Rummeliibacillus pycnus TaxID=101070 RepID=UPI000C998612|nr:transcriptional regulator [Rummeliibacillus pycnus]